MNQKQHTALTATIIVILILLPFKCAAPQINDSTHSFLAGVRINNSLPYGTIGYITHPSPTLMICYTGDLGGQQAALHPELFLSLYHSTNITLWASLGPNLELIQRNIDTDDPILYLSALTGLGVTYTLFDQTHLHIGFNWLTPADPPKPWKVYFYLSAPITGAKSTP